MDYDPREIQQGKPTIPPDDPPLVQEPVNEEGLANMFVTGKSPDEPPTWFITKYGLEMWAVWQILFEGCWNT